MIDKEKEIRFKKIVRQFLKINGLVQDWKNYVMSHKTDSTWYNHKHVDRIIGASEFTLFLREEKHKDFSITISQGFRHFLKDFYPEEELAFEPFINDDSYFEKHPDNIHKKIKILHYGK